MQVQVKQKEKLRFNKLIVSQYKMFYNALQLVNDATVSVF